jgi:hypothetical protein
MDAGVLIGGAVPVRPGVVTVAKFTTATAWPGGPFQSIGGQANVTSLCLMARIGVWRCWRVNSKALWTDFPFTINR